MIGGAGGRSGRLPRVRDHAGQSATPHAAAAPVGTTFVAVEGARVSAHASAADALAAAEAIRAAEPQARVAVHLDEAYVDDGDHAGAGVSRCRRLCEIAWPGQTLVSAAAASAAGDLVPPGTELDDVGVHRLRDLSPALRLYALVAAGGEADPPRSLAAHPNNLPSFASTFVGRAGELAELELALSTTPLLTIVGPGGSGKTRLAAQLAAEQAGRRPDGVWWVELAELADPAQVGAAVARVLGVLVDPSREAAESLAAQLAAKRLLLCLDNCEHVLGAAADVAARLCRECPDVAIVATSREPLGLAGEVVWRVPPLPAREARALFIERAAHVRRDLALDDEADAAIASMCARLDGSPLALELAAAWLRTLAPRQIEEGLDDRFSLLVRSPRDAVARQTSLLASMAWSHDLLDEHDRAVFRRLAVFAGGFDLRAARDVCAGDPVEPGAVLGAVGRLVDKSLVVAEDAGGERRYRLLETVRQYAANRLAAAGERRAVADRHLDHMLARVEALAPELERDRDAWRAALAREHDNLRAAIGHGLDAADPARGRRLASELPWLWHMHRQGREGMAILRRAIARAPGERSPVQARLLAGVALVADTAGPLDVEVDAGSRAAELAAELGDERLLALCRALTAVGLLYTDLDGAYETSLDSERLAERSGEPFVVDAGRALRGIVLHLRDEHAEAGELLAGAAARLSEHGERGVSSTALAFLSGGALLTGDLDRARELGERSIAIAAPLADHLRIGMGRSALALALGAGGDVEAGLAALAPVAPLVEDGGHFLPDVNRALGLLHLWAGDAERAVARLTAEAASTDRGEPTFHAVRALPALAAAQREAGRPADAAATAERGAALARARRMPAVLAGCLTEQARASADPDAAVRLHHEALAIRADRGLRPGVVESLEAIAALGAGDAEQDVRLLAAAAAARERMSLPPRAAPRHDARRPPAPHRGATPRRPPGPHRGATTPGPRASR